MRIIATIREMHAAAGELRHDKRRIGLVPTMGYLHEGHLSLMRICHEHADVVVASIFVNPTQFAPSEDYSKYPRNLERDIRLAESAGTDVLFTPSTEEMYPRDHTTYVDTDRITQVLEGKSRPSHFRGVTTIVAKLFNITHPDVAVFGQKDAQQVVVVKRMAADLDFDVEIVVAPIVREHDGLAMSSRNVFLSAAERKQSTVLFASLRLAEQRIRGGERQSSSIVSEMTEMIQSQPAARIDYISIADPLSLGEVGTIPPGGNVLVSLAVKFGSTRLIDNVLVPVP